MNKIIYKDRNIIFSNNPSMIVRNATVEEIEDDKLHVTGELLHTKYIEEGYPYYNFMLSLEKGLCDSIIDKSKIWNANPTPYNKPKILTHVYSIDRGFILKLIKFLIEGLSFDFIKLPTTFTTTLCMRAGNYTTGYVRPVDMKITDEEYRQISLLENAKVTIKNIIE